jgi:hypothetical protein
MYWVYGVGPELVLLYYFDWLYLTYMALPVELNSSSHLAIVALEAYSEHWDHTGGHLFIWLSTPASLLLFLFCRLALVNILSLIKQ